MFERDYLLPHEEEIKEITDAEAIWSVASRWLRGGRLTEGVTGPGYDFIKAIENYDRKKTLHFLLSGEPVYGKAYEKESKKSPLVMMCQKNNNFSTSFIKNVVKLKVNLDAPYAETEWKFKGEDLSRRHVLITALSSGQLQGALSIIPRLKTLGEKLDNMDSRGLGVWCAAFLGNQDTTKYWCPKIKGHDAGMFEGEPLWEALMALKAQINKPLGFDFERATSRYSFRVSKGSTPLMIAASDSHVHIESLKSLLKAGADLEARDAYGYDAVACAIRHGAFNNAYFLMEQKELIESKKNNETTRQLSDTQRPAPAALPMDHLYSLIDYAFEKQAWHDPSVQQMAEFLFQKPMIASLEKPQMHLFSAKHDVSEMKRCQYFKGHKAPKWIDQLEVLEEKMALEQELKNIPLQTTEAKRKMPRL